MTSTIRKLIFVAAICAGFSLYAQNNGSLTLEDIYDSSKFHGTLIQEVQWLPDGSAFIYMKDDGDENSAKNIFKHEVESGVTSVLLQTADLKYGDEPIEVSGYSRTPDGKFLLLVDKEKRIWRHSREARHFIYEVATGKLTPLADGRGNLRNAKLSPDGTRVGYVRDYNLYVADIQTGVEQAITTDGTADILNAEFDWVYEEEFGSDDAWRWSPDGSKIAFWQVNQTRVKPFHLVDELPLYNTVFELKYPKAGEENAIVKIAVADLVTGDTNWMDIGGETDMYIPKIFWTNSSDRLAMMRLNRLQNHLELLLADAASGQSQIILQDSSTTWIDVEHELFFLQNKPQFIWTSTRSGFNHAYLYDYDGRMLQQLTGGEWEVSEIAGVDEAQQWVYFYAKKDSPIEQNVYRVKLDGSGLQRVSQRAGWHTGNFAPDYRHVVGFFSDVSTPTQTVVRQSDGKLVRMLEQNEIPALQELDLPAPEFLRVKTTDGVELNASMIKPANFDPNKKYSVLVYGYGGPGSQVVVNRWGGNRTLWHQYLTEKGYIIFSVDNRGTGGRGKAFRDFAYGDISKWAVHDQIEGAKYLQSLPYVDGERIGFWGWSGGGYLTFMVMMRGGQYFKTGVSVAPVSNFRFYDTIWTERYMGLPDLNHDGYEAANVLHYIDGLSGNLLIVHGTGDDNVHFQNSVHVIHELQNRAMQFDLMIYPNKNHRIFGGKTQLHLFTKITDYLLQNL